MRFGGGKKSEKWLIYLGFDEGSIFEVPGFPTDDELSVVVAKSLDPFNALDISEFPRKFFSMQDIS